MAPLFLFILLSPLCLQVNAQNRSYEQTILLTMKQHWGNPPPLLLWSLNSSSPCDWPGVECTTSGAVKGLSLAGKRINGTIPPSIGQLDNLVSVDLSRNNLSGRVPVSLSNCSKLEYLDLSLNALSGAIPGEFLLMERLRSLSLYENRLSGEIPTPMRAWSLTTLHLSGNQIGGSIPYGMRNLRNLVRLDLSRNLFSGTIPVELFHMRQLEYLSLDYNNLTGQLPAEMDFTNLGFINLAHNKLHGSIPKNLDEVTGLTTMDLSDNQLSGDIMESLFRARPMNALRLCSNKFWGKIPYEFVNHRITENCLDRANLCSDNRNEGLPSCPPRLCSDHRFQGFLKCDQKNERSRRHFIIIMVETSGCGIVGFAVLYYLARKCWLKKHESIVASFKKIRFYKHRPSLKDKEELNMVAFQRLNFNKLEILSGLTDENMIGNGGSGKVYRVLINQTGYTVAVKSITNATKSDHRLQKEFLAEIQTLGSIRHYNIVKLLCYISGKALKLLVYQYFENKSLDQWLHSNKREISSVGNSSVTNLNWPMRMHIAIGAAQGLCYMHHDCSPPIIHRDIKSSNILLDSEFNPKIADFGLAKLLNKHGGTEIASAVAGTFGYIAPEYAYTAKFNTKIDVYSFGVVLLELTTGREAVTRGDHMNLAERALLVYRDTSSVLDALDDEIKDPNYLDQIITVFRLGVICTASLPSDRPSMKDCLQILQNCSKSSSSPNMLMQ